MYIHLLYFLSMFTIFNNVAPTFRNRIPYFKGTLLAEGREHENDGQCVTRGFRGGLIRCTTY